jgi:hypothetical protein
MNPSKLKLPALALIAVVSVAMNLVLLDRLHRTRAQVETWKGYHEKVARRLLEAETGPRSQPVAEAEPLPLLSRPKPATLKVAPCPKLEGTPPQKKEAAEDDDFREKVIQGMLASAIEKELPELELSEIELREMTAAVITIRDSMQELRVLERTSENAEDIRRLRDRMKEAMGDLEQITDMSAEALMLRAPAEGGIDHDEADDEEVVLEYLRDFRR